MSGGPQENEVAQEIGREERFPACVQGFKDNLRVVAALQINNDDLERILEGLERFLQASRQRRFSAKRLFAVSFEEFSQSFVKEEVSLNHAGARIVFSCILSPPQWMFLFDFFSTAGSDDILKLWAIALRWPNLELIHIGVYHHSPI
jgi:hypothetical protein